MGWPEDHNARSSFHGVVHALPSSPVLPPLKKPRLSPPDMAALDLDSDKLWFRERWLRTTVTGDLAEAVHAEEENQTIHPDPHEYCTSALFNADDHAPSTLTPDSDPRSTSNDFDVPDEGEIEEDPFNITPPQDTATSYPVYDEYDDFSSYDPYDDFESTSSEHDPQHQIRTQNHRPNPSSPSRPLTPSSPLPTFTTEDIVLHTRIEAHLTTLEDLLEQSTSPASLSRNISLYLTAFHSNLRVLNRGGGSGTATVKLMRVARMPSAGGLVDQGKRIMGRLRGLREGTHRRRRDGDGDGEREEGAGREGAGGTVLVDGGHEREGGEQHEGGAVGGVEASEIRNLGVPLPVGGEERELEGRRVVSMFELFDAYVVPFFIIEEGGSDMG